MSAWNPAMSVPFWLELWRYHEEGNLGANPVIIAARRRAEAQNAAASPADLALVAADVEFIRAGLLQPFADAPLISMITAAARIAAITGGAGPRMAETAELLQAVPADLWLNNDKEDFQKSCGIPTCFAKAIDDLARLPTPSALEAFVRAFAPAIERLRANSADFRAGFEEILAYTAIWCSDESWAVLCATGWQPSRAVAMKKFSLSFHDGAGFRRAVARFGVEPDELVRDWLDVCIKWATFDVLEIFRDDFGISWYNVWHARPKAAQSFEDLPLGQLFMDKSGRGVAFLASIGAQRQAIVQLGIESVWWRRDDPAHKTAARVLAIAAVCAVHADREDCEDCEIWRADRYQLVDLARVLGAAGLYPAALRVLYTALVGDPQAVETVIVHSRADSNWSRIVDRCIEADALTPKTYELCQTVGDTQSLAQVLARVRARACGGAPAAVHMFEEFIKYVHAKEPHALEILYNNSTTEDLGDLAVLPPECFACVAPGLVECMLNGPRSARETNHAFDPTLLEACFEHCLDNAKTVCELLDKNSLAKAWREPRVLAAIRWNLKEHAEEAIFAPTSSWPAALCFATSADELVRRLADNEMFRCVHEDQHLEIVMIFGALACREKGDPDVAAVTDADADASVAAAWCELAIAAVASNAKELAAAAFEHAGELGRRIFWNHPRFALAAAGVYGVAVVGAARERGLMAVLKKSAKLRLRDCVAELHRGFAEDREKILALLAD